MYIYLIVYISNRNFGGVSGNFEGTILSIDPVDEELGVVVRYNFGTKQHDFKMDIGGLADHCKLDRVLESHAINYDNALVVSFSFYLYFL